MLFKLLTVLAVLGLVLGQSVGPGTERCASYTVTHVYGSKGISSSNSGNPSVDCCQKGDTGSPGKAGPATQGEKGEKGDPAPDTFYRNYWTRSRTGCDCYFDNSSTDCACCYEGNNCQCGPDHRHQCVPCGVSNLCGVREPPRSCEFIDMRISGTYLISPAPELCQPFHVYCNFSGNQVKTVIRHDTLAEKQAKNCEPQKCAASNIQYNANMQSIAAMIGVSANCRQFIKYRCIGSVLFQGPDFFSTWIARDGSQQRYWGGATSERNWYCACGEDGSCDDPTKLCNCDINGGPETSDEGYLTDKAKLPVTGVRFGDLGDASESGWFTLGPLECFGRR